jgi:hypothetical protein
MENEEKHICDYGCGREAKYKMTSGKWCCEIFYSMCPAIKNKTKNCGSKNGAYGKPGWNIGLTKDTDERVKRISSSNIGKKNSKEHNIKIGTSQKGKIVKPESIKKLSLALTGRPSKNKGKRLNLLNFYLSNHPNLFKYEKIELDKDSNELIVCCNNCGKKYIPQRGNIRYRADMIKHGYLNRGCLYCSEECKSEAVNKNKRLFDWYTDRVLKETYKSVTKNKHKIKDIELRGKDFHLDHKFSIIEGFRKNIDPKFIGHWKNLEILPRLVNNKKLGKCSITLNELLTEIQKVESDPIL